MLKPVAAKNQPSRLGGRPRERQGIDQFESASAGRNGLPSTREPRDTSKAVAFGDALDSLDPAVLGHGFDTLTAVSVVPGHDGLVALLVTAGVTEPARAHLGISA